jgi:hypothetical protein
MLKSKVRTAAAALAILGVFAGQFAVVSSAEAKSSKCFATAVPGSPGTFVITCTTTRP